MCLYSPDMAAAHLYGATFVWDGNGPLMHWSRPAAVAAIYLALCVIHNRARATSSKDPSNKHSSAPVLSAVGVAHNALLVAFSALVSVAASSGGAAALTVDFWWIKPQASNPGALEPLTLPRNAKGPHKNDPGRSRAVYAPLAALFTRGGTSSDGKLRAS